MMHLVMKRCDRLLSVLTSRRTLICLICVVLIIWIAISHTLDLKEHSKCTSKIKRNEVMNVKMRNMIRREFHKELLNELTSIHLELQSFSMKNASNVLEKFEAILHQLRNMLLEKNNTMKATYAELKSSGNKGTMKGTPTPHVEITTSPISKKYDNMETTPSTLEGKKDLWKNDTINVTSHLDKKDVCPEIFLGEVAGNPFYTQGWVLTNCDNVKPIKSVISILINAVAYNTQDFARLGYVLDGIAESYPTVDILLAIQDKQSMKNIKNYNNLKVLKILNLNNNSSSEPVLKFLDLEHNTSPEPVQGEIWNKLIKRAKTPYVLIARDVVHFSWLSQLERLIRVVSEIPNVGVAGGSYRNLSGHWRMGCFQSTLKNYVLEYQEGYFHSRNECMLCNYLQGPFVARKSVLHFDETVSDEVVFEDLFLTLTRKGKLIMGCPDAMYFTRGEVFSLKDNEKRIWKKFAEKWTLNRILLSSGLTHSFSCKDIGYKCDLLLTRWFLLPVCCQEQYEHALSVFQDFANKHNFSFELDTGSVLGTVKYNGLMPWDVDGDVRLLSTDIGIFNTQEAEDYFDNHGLWLTGYEEPQFDGSHIITRFNKTVIRHDGTVRIKTPDLHIELWGRRQLTCPQFLPKDLQNDFTLALVRGTWVKTVFSPGLFVRNRYGVEILKHSQSWVIRNMKHSLNAYQSGSFMSCKNANHHSCLQNFPADGNIPFLVP